MKLEDMAARSGFDYEQSAARNQAKYAYTGTSQAFEKAYDACRACTMVSKERQIHFFDAVQYVSRAGVPGAIMECGVWRGGGMMMAAFALLDLDTTDRELWLYDTFAGHPQPDQVRDIDIHGNALVKQYEKLKTEDGFSDWARVSLADTHANMQSTGYPAERMRFIKGKVEDTVPEQAPQQIAILRLDTDWYESTRHTLEQLFPRLSPGGVLIIDDYGHMRGAQEAADEYFQEHNIHILLNRVDYSCRSAIKR